MPSKKIKTKSLPKQKRASSSTKTEVSTKSDNPKLPNVFKLSVASLQIIYKNPLSFTLIILIYIILTLLLVKGFGSSTNVAELKGLFSNLFHGSSSAISTNLSVFGILVGSATSSSGQNSGMFQTILLIIFSLVIIWAVRESTKGNSFKLRDAFYKSSYPLIPFLLVLLILIIETLPMIIGIFLYSTIINNGIAVHLAEKIIWGIISLGLVYVSLYLIVSSVFAVYIVTLPDLRPIQAVKSAWRLVKKRRFLVFRKIIWLPIALLIASGLITIPFIVLFPWLAPWVFFIVSVITVAVVHSYMYNLYRELL